MNYKLSPSLLSANFYNLENDLKILESEKIEYLHLDVMDGMFVPNISFGIPVIKSLSKYKNNFIFDTHLMIEEPIRYVKQFKDAGADYLTVHYEACKDIIKTLQTIKMEGMKSGISIKPKTSVNEIRNILQYVDLVLIMSVEPGFGGQEFMENSIPKVIELKNERSKNNLDFFIEIDGGINEFNIKKVVDAGCDLVVAGSAIFKNDIKENIKKLNI